MAIESTKNSNDEAMNLYKDMLSDMKDQRKSLKTVIVVLSFIVMCLIGGIIGLAFHSQKLLKEMSIECEQKIIDILGETEFITEYTIDTDGQSLNNGNITVTK